MGHQGQLPRRPDRLPAAQRAAGLDRRHRRRSPPPPRTSSTSRTFLVDWLRRPRARAGARRRDGGLRGARRAEAAARARDFPDPESTAIWSDAAVWVPWALWQAYGDRPSSSGSTTRWPPTSAGSRRCSRRPACGTPASSSATGSTPTRPRTQPAEREGRHGRRRHRLPSTDPHDRRRHGRAARPRRRRGRLPSLADRTRDGVQRALRRRRRHRRVRLHHRLRARDRVRPARRSEPRPRRRPARRARGARAATGSRPASPARRSSPTRSPRPGTSTTPTGCCCSASARRGSTP